MDDSSKVRIETGKYIIKNIWKSYILNASYRGVFEGKRQVRYL